MWRRKTRRRSAASTSNESRAVDGSRMKSYNSSRSNTQANTPRRRWDSTTDARRNRTRGSSMPSPRRAIRHWRSTARMEQLVADEIEQIIFGPGCDDFDERYDDDEDVASFARGENKYQVFGGRRDEHKPRQRQRQRRLSLSSLRGSRNSASPTDGGHGSNSVSEAVSFHMNRARRLSLPAADEDSSTMTGRGRQRRRSLPTESSINRYSLFENDNSLIQTTTLLSSASRNGTSLRNLQKSHHSKSPTILYGKSYHPNFAFTPLIMFLGATFVILLILRIIVSLLTVAMGVIVLIVAAIGFFDFIRNPRNNAKRLLTTVHNAPVIVFGAMGGLCGACVCLWVYRKTDEASLTWGLLEGVVYGVEIGALWLVVLGNGSDYSATALWIMRIWDNICRRFFPDTPGHDGCDSSSTCLDETLHNDDEDGDVGGDDEDRRKCMICLCRFGPTETRELLPCFHGFHPQCLEKWLSVSRTCPTCRTPSSIPTIPSPSPSLEPATESSQQISSPQIQISRGQLNDQGATAAVE